MSNHSSWSTRIRQTHKWLGLIIGLQLCLWVISGLYMSFIDLDKIHGKHLYRTSTNIIAPATVSPLPDTYDDISQLTLTQALGQAIYIIEQSSQQIVVNATTLSPLVIDQAYIQAQASDLYTGTGAIESIEKLAQYPAELGGRKQPIWQVNFNDSFNPSLYFSATTGQFIKARSDLWRWFDIMWMLHIMDYQERSDVNNKLLTLASSLAFLALCSGIWLLFYSFSSVPKPQAGSLMWLRTAHKWVAGLIGIQLILWVVSGLVFNWFTSEQINPRHQLLPQVTQPFKARDIDITQLLSTQSAIYHIAITATPNASQVIINQQYQQPLSVDTQALTPLSQAQAINVADRVYFSLHDITSTQLIRESHALTETRKFKRAVWQINYADVAQHSLYLDAYTGQALTLKNDDWRLKDWFWMLHIMDYQTRSDFNNPLLITIASIASFSALSGFLMLFYVFSTKDFRFKRQPKSHQIGIYSATQLIETITVQSDKPLLAALAEQDVQLPSGCGGGGTCCQCMIKTSNLITPLNTQEQSSLSVSEMNQGYRLACQIQACENLNIELPQSSLTQQQITARVISNAFLTPFIKELVIELPANSSFSFDAGQFVNIQVPAYQQSFSQLSIPAQYRGYWQQQRLLSARVSAEQPLMRSYSIATSAHNQGHIQRLTFIVKLALPQAGYGLGLASSYLFGLAAGSPLTLSGPLGDFVERQHNLREMVLIGGGSGMAPLRSHIDTALAQHPLRQVSLWFGARHQDDIFYQDHFEQLARKHRNFAWHVSLSQPQGNDWAGKQGHIQTHLFNDYLNQHPRLHLCDFFLCGPPAMMRDITRLLRAKGILETQIRCDDFGAPQ
ncbi:NADH:ubiquinone reductase (Na(+)-transporting) subunit F [Psychrobium sp. 1_MG-2023]|uniref:NADH:ubiquinone reductase (Na(+)-transporting) subunit F n=1 Tax=Psychrobium sp. 1_MG-2023 TaxID=3062624 RepID=UPI000C33714E|nr:NADH:ubiquinone reductase (Na(+)-transporting) subunit F [Psychrobium sp. 1_MG-2023]MDP2559602.1 NADH:ubiquinone reductase (Na(+)-transporting) subunit F [Psychrobium sp. 1_MG-2023]PKF59436.1 NADH:ubiquinone reductase (Na(+)-transporting) subunit F [Alteromonadales bacterium alter-6D02]